MQNYQLTVLVKNTLDEKERAALLDQIKKQFGSLKKEDLWGARSLAYPIAHQDKAYFAHYEFESEPNTIFDLDKSVKLNEDIIRYLLTKVESKKVKVKKGNAKVAEPIIDEVITSEGEEVEQSVNEEKE